MSDDLEPNLDEVIDFRFAEIEAELFVLEEYAQAIERQLPLAIMQEVQRLEDEMAGADDLERPSVQEWIRQFAEDDLPRLFRAPIIVALWAVFESGIIEIAKYLQDQKRHSLGVEDLRGENILVRAEKYYEHVLHVPLISDEANKKKIQMLATVRNAIAHANGRIEAIRPGMLQSIRSWGVRMVVSLLISHT